jgi:TonB family protein
MIVQHSYLPNPIIALLSVLPSAKPTFVRAAFIVLILSISALAQTLTKAPTIVKSVEPIFPVSQLDAGIGGTVVMDIDIGIDGKVINAVVTKSLGADFDEAALTAVKQLEFTPAEVDGQAAPVRIQFSSEFTLRAVETPMEIADSGIPIVNLKGTLKTAGTREPVVGALVTVNGVESISTDLGQFEFTDLPVGAVELSVNAAGYETLKQSENIAAKEKTVVTYYLTKNGGFETVVRDVKERREVAQVKLSSSEIRMIPGTNNDAFKVVQNLPGVARSPFGGGALVVRGSKAWDSRIYIDEIQIPQLFHFAGLTSTFNSTLIDKIAFQPGNFSSDFGRSIGGLIQGEVKELSKTGFHGYADVNVFDISARVETPVTNEWSVTAAARFGLAQYVLPFAIKTFAPSISGSVGFTLAPQYWDYQVRAERKLANSKNRMFIGIFGASDAWAFVQPNPFLDNDFEGNSASAGNSQLYNRVVFGLDQRLSDKLSSVTRASIGFDLNSQSGTVKEIFFNTQLIPIQVRQRFKYEIPQAHVSLGFGFDGLLTFSSFEAQRPPVFKANQLPDPYITRRLTSETERTTYIEPGLFVDATWTPIQRLQVRGGLRVDTELGVMKKVWVNPRLGARFEVLENFALKAGVGMYQQPPDYRQGQLSSVFGNPALEAEGAWHFMAGAETKLFNLIELDGQAYYKALFNQARQVLANGGADISIPGAETRFSSTGYGRSYGMEVLARVRPTKYFLGWIAYSLSRFERDYYGDVKYAPGPLDQPHNLIAVASFSLPYNFNVGARFRYASGPLVTPFISSIFDANGNYYVPLPALPWSKRLPDFTQLDVRIDKRFVFDAFSLVAYLDIQNVTNAQNPEGLIYNFNYTKSSFITSIPILPTLGLRGEW